MNENKKKMYDLSGPKTVEAMKKRHFDAYYCSTAAEAVKKALELIPKTDSVSWGGVMTVDELVFADEIDCRELFDGNDARERIVEFVLE